MIEALLGFAAIFALTLVRMPLAFSMGLVGIAGIGLTRGWDPVSYTHLRAHETVLDLVCRLLLEKKNLTTDTR